MVAEVKGSGGQRVNGLAGPRGGRSRRKGSTCDGGPLSGRHVDIVAREAPKSIPICGFCACQTAGCLDGLIEPVTTRSPLRMGRMLCASLPSPLRDIPPAPGALMKRGRRGRRKFRNARPTEATARWTCPNPVIHSMTRRQGQPTAGPAERNLSGVPDGVRPPGASASDERRWPPGSTRRPGRSTLGIRLRRRIPSWAAPSPSARASAPPEWRGKQPWRPPG